MTSDKPLRRRYTGRSHTLLVLGPPTVGWITSAIFVFVGPYSLWTNYLVAGMIWGVTLPLRNIFRAALKYITHEFRDPELFSWWACVGNEATSEFRDFRREPLHFLGAWLLNILMHTFLWPIAVYLGMSIKGSLDHG